MTQGRLPEPVFSDRLDRAFAYARELHARQGRKGTTIPYLTHLMSVAAIVGENGGSEDQVIAGLLHDAVEDQGGMSVADEIRRRFGDTVAMIVLACSDSVSADGRAKAPWRSRKEAYLRHLKEQVGRDPKEMALVRLVSAADKFHNARAIVSDLRRHGPAVWSRFSGGREGTLWYYRELLSALSDGWSSPVLEELDRVVREMEQLAARAT
jgi:(p)ppGpp synthase/HD superfamily hydrolase